MASFIMLSFIPTQLKAETEKSTAAAVTTKTTESTDVNAIATANAAEDARAEAQLSRLEEIKAMDMSELTPSEKKELRDEVHMIQNQQDRHDRDRGYGDGDGRRHHRGGIVFVGGGGLLLILLILLLL